MTNDISPSLSLPYIQPAQAQKHVTHNDALERLDILTQLVVKELNALVPPTLPEEGDTYIIGASAAWAGRGGEIASYRNGGWLFISPQPGWHALDQENGGLHVFIQDAWQPVQTQTQNLDGVGIDAAWDTVNRLSIRSQASLFSHAGTDHRLKVNKGSAGDTGSLLFQSNWSGRAEMGLIGEEDFSVRISPDGNSWVTALSVGASDGYIGIGTAQPGYPLTVTASDTGSPIAIRLQNYQGEGSTLAATRGLVLSADHDDNSSGVQSSITCKVDDTEIARFEAGGDVHLGRLGSGGRVRITDALSLTPGAAPSVPEQGDLYFDATTAKLRCWDGTTWQDLF